MSSEDIRKQLPEDSERFDNVDKDFKELTTEMSKIPNVVESTNKPGLLAILEDLQKNLTLCEKALAVYLETKRLFFPRFYFISSADLLDILSNGNQPELVAKHLTKLFDSIARLNFGKEEDGTLNKLIHGMHAKDGEYIDFNEVTTCSEAVRFYTFIV
jgi:dynein heavy chain